MIRSNKEKKFQVSLLRSIKRKTSFSFTTYKVYVFQINKKNVNLYITTLRSCHPNSKPISIHARSNPWLASPNNRKWKCVGTKGDRNVTLVIAPSPGQTLNSLDVHATVTAPLPPVLVLPYPSINSVPTPIGTNVLL
ncbi:hypothetical protein ElyMa_001529700 [Elysia marginata]|uniref:Uncharacterized protein n=1 Tax=Elysia marginata TaxID=1093978 RepID=A0AAV4J8K4_9GAST|nr:hypothetical protein ElyMa_001529700 [Elysia marginata]